MSDGTPTMAPGKGRRLVAVCLFLAVIGFGFITQLPTSPARAEEGGALVAEPVLSAAAAGVKELFGPSPDEAPGEVWGAGIGRGQEATLVRYTEAGDWETAPPPVNQEGKPIDELQIPPIALAGKTTEAGGVVVAASEGTESASSRFLIMRDPGGGFHAVAPERSSTAGGAKEGKLEVGEELFKAGPVGRFVQFAAVEEAEGETGAYVVPSPKSGVPKNVLHYDGTHWTHEEICKSVTKEGTCAAPPAFSVVAIEASGPNNAWILGKEVSTGRFGEKKGEGIMLFRRTEAGMWVLTPKLGGGALGELFALPEKAEEGTTVFTSAREKGQPLTVTSQGVWVDATVGIGSATAPTTDATIYYDIEKGQVTGSWCDLPAVAPPTREKICARPLGSELTAEEGRSFAWPPAPGEEFGTRAITGVGQGAMLIFENGAFSRIPLAGNGGSSAGAALSAPDQGWLGPSYRLTRAPVPSGLQPWPVPFRRPLTAIATQPGTAVASLSAEALAVGQQGQVARYVPGQGWEAESLLTGSGARATPNLRGVAWPVPGVAYAVGDEGAMWLWRSTTDLWEPDPGSPPNLIRGDFTGIAFDPNEPERGYAVGKQGLLLSYGRRWTQEALPAELDPEVNLTSVAFAGNEALATYTLASCCATDGGAKYSGGLLANDGTGWRVEPEASAVLAEAEGVQGEVAPRRVAGLADGGAVIAGANGGVIEREAAGAPWHAAAGAPVGYPAALAAVREGGQVRAVMSVEGTSATVPGVPTLTKEKDNDLPQALGQPPAGQAPLLTEPYPLPKVGYLIRQTSTGWRDEEHQAYPTPPRPTDQIVGVHLDLPRLADPVLALAINEAGTEGWAVGGQTGELATSSEKGEALQTSAAMRYGPAAAPPENASSAPIQVGANEATFAVGGGAQCAGACADMEGVGIGPDVWLRAAVARAAGISGLRGFLYTGTSVSENLNLSNVTADAFGEEEAAYARRLGSAAGSLPVYAAPSATDLYGSSLATFAAEFAGFSAPLGAAPALPGVSSTTDGDREEAEGGNYSYAFTSSSGAGSEPVRVVVLDTSRMPLSQGKQCWLARQLSEAKEYSIPALVMGNNEVGSEAALQQLLVTGTSPLTAGCVGSAGPASASAYLFETEGNVSGNVTWGQASIPAFGTGTLGYSELPETLRRAYIPASGFLLVSVNSAARNPATNAAPVTAKLIPSIGSLAIEAIDGTLLRRSQTALFEALARRPIAGIECEGNGLPSGVCERVKPDPYVQIPARCVNQVSCQGEVLPEYEFTSSRPDIANFVEVDPSSTNPRTVYLDSSGKPVADPKSGLLCAFNAGTTTVTVNTGGLTYSIPVTVQTGSVQRPCGTVPLLERPIHPHVEAEPLEPFPTNEPQSYTHPHIKVHAPSAPTPAPNPSPSPSPSPNPPPVHHPIKPPAVVHLPYFPAPTPGIALTPVIVPPPPAPVVEPTPPSGTSPVTQPAVSPQPEEEEEAAFDLVHHMTAHRHERGENAAAILSSGSGGASGTRYFVPAFVLLLALAGVGARPRRRRGDLAYESRPTPRRPKR